MNAPRGSNCIQINADSYTNSESLALTPEAEVVETCIRNAHAYGNKLPTTVAAALSNGLANMLEGMAHAVRIYTDMKMEIHNLHEGIFALRDEASEAKDRIIGEESTRLRKMEVMSLIYSNMWTANMERN
jgi:hypothetical protein